MSVKIAEYKFNSSIDTLFSEVNEGFVYTHTDIDNGDGTITRTIYSDQLPTKIRFEDCEGLLELLYLNTSELTTFRKTFKNCYNVTSINTTDWDTSKITSLYEAFEDCNNLTTLDVSNFDTSNVTDMEGMFLNCQSLTSLVISNFNTSNVTNMYAMFAYCQSLTSLDLSNFDTSNVTNMKSMFYDCQSLTSIDVSNFNTSNVTDMGYMFTKCNNLTTLDVSNFDTSKVIDMVCMFYDCQSLTSIDVSKWDTSNVTDMRGMFYNCNKLTSLDVSNFNTSNVTNMYSMFYDCQSLTSLDVSNFNTSNVTDMTGMFYGCNNLTSLDVSNFDTSNVTDMSYMFSKCQSLTSLDVSNFDTSNVTNTYAMFDSCVSLTSLDLSGWNTINMINMNSMFSGCTSLNLLNLSNWVLDEVDIGYLCSRCTCLTTMILNNWNFNKPSWISNIFNGCINLNLVYMENSNVQSINNIIDLLPTRASDSMGALNIAGIDDVNQIDIDTAESKYWNILTMYLSEDVLNINVNQTKSIHAISDKDVVWESDNENILIKDNNITNLEQIVLYGNLCSVEYSNCELTQTYNSFNVISYSSSSVTVKIRINNLDPNEIYTFSMGYLSGTTVEIYYGDNYQGGSTSKTYTITGSDSCTLVYYRNSGTTELWGINNLLLVDSNGNDNSSMLNGKILYVTGVTEGSSIITCTTVDGYETYKCTINISNIDKNNIGASRGLISWRHSDFLYKTDLIVDTMKALNLNVLHQQFTHKDFEDLSTLATSINNFRNNMNYDIEISAIIGDPSYYLPEKIDRILARIDNVINLNNDTDAHIDSIFIDIEPWAISGIEIEDWLDDYKNNMQQAYNYCKENGLKFILCVPFWLDSSADIKNYNANYYKEIIDICDELVVMNFNRSGQINNIKEEIEYCKLTNKRICSIAECQYFSDEQDAKLSYFNGDPQVVNSDWLNLYNAFDYDNIGFIFHCFHDGIIDWINIGKVEDVYNPYVVEYTFNKTIDTLPTVNDDFIYTYIDIDNNDDTITRLIVSENPLTKIRFESCEGLLSLESLNISNLTTFRKLFYECANLQNIENISCYNTIDITDMSYLFYNCESLTTIDMSNWDTSNVTKMNNMFYGCNNLTSLDVSNFNTSNVTTMYGMFIGCESLTTLDVSNFDTSNVTTMYGMFYACKSLTTLDLSDWDTSEVTDMSWMFGFYENGDEIMALTSIIGLESWDTSSVTNMGWMFCNCKNLTTIDVSNWDTSSVTDMSGIFYNCTNLTTLDVSNFDTSKVTTMEYMFYGCSNLTSIDVNNFDTSKVTNMTCIFESCQSLTTLDLSNWNTSNVTSMNYMFTNDNNLNNITMNNSDYSSVNKIIEQLPTRTSDSIGILKIEGVDDHKLVNKSEVGLKYWAIMTVFPNIKYYTLLNEDEGKYAYPIVNLDESILSNSSWLMSFIDDEIPDRTVLCFEIETKEDINSIQFVNPELLLKVLLLDTSNMTTMKDLFKDCTQLNSIECSDWDTSNVTDMSSMFSICQSLTSIDVSNWDTSKVTDMSSMFNSCNKLTSLDVSNFDISKVSNMNRTFYGCNKLTSLDVSDWDTSNVTDMNRTFYGCNNLTTLDVSNWDTSNVTTMSYMFCYCNNLTSLDVNNWNTSNVTDMNRTFYGCNNLTTLDVSNWDTSNVTTMSYMFCYCNNLTSLDVSNFDISKVSNMKNMFNNCNNLTLVSMNNSDYNSVNKIVEQIPTRTEDNKGTLNITGIDDISQVNITTAESKYWNTLNLKQYKVHLIPINNNKVNKVYSLNKKIKISFYK